VVIAALNLWQATQPLQLPQSFLAVLATIDCLFHVVFLLVIFTFLPPKQKTEVDLDVATNISGKLSGQAPANTSIPSHSDLDVDG
jgi:hypothetical protein